MPFNLRFGSCFIFIIFFNNRTIKNLAAVEITSKISKVGRKFKIKIILCHSYLNKVILEIKLK